MTQIRVMFSSRPKLLSDIIHHLIDRQSNMRVVGEVVDPIELLIVLKSTPADVVIITPLKTNGDPRICGQLLKEYPHLKILVLTQNSDAVSIYRSGSDRVRIERPSEQTILDVIMNTLEP